MKFVAGLVVGALITFLVMRVTTSEVTAPTQAPVATQANAQNVARGAAAEKSSSPPQSVPPMSTAEHAAPSVGSTSSTATAMSTATAASTMAEPSNLSTAHAQLLKQPEPGRSGPSALETLHQDFQKQSRDESWAIAAEQNVKQYLAQAAQPPEFNVAAVECRNNLCEIQAYGYTEASSNKWNGIVSAMSQQPWWYLFSGSSSSSSTTNGQAVMLTVLQRGST